MEEELIVLKSIYLDELLVSDDSPTTVTITIYSNGDENDPDREKRLLCVTFVADLPVTYPDTDPPKITLCRSRGLTDEQLAELNSAIADCLQSNAGSCVLYECIELIRSQLSSYELPHEACAICLSLITDRSEIIKTNCHHFYHKNCLKPYVDMKKNELEERYQEMKKNGFYIERDFRQDIEDPVCRQILSEHVIAQLPSALSVEESAADDQQALVGNLSERVRQWQERTQALFQQQKEKGGIIDLDRNQEMIFS